MLGSRREKFASIYMRVKGMINKGALAYEHRPLWYDVYEAFPPRVDPAYHRPCPTNTVRNILYPEDCERAAFYGGQYKSETLNMFKLMDNRSSLSKLLQKCDQLRKLNPDMSSEELVSLAKEELIHSGLTTRHKFESDAKS
ncbi:28S ribosomal protein S23, mitochondrial [Schistosoma japonicum]|uniref:Small ribosomal subunit protein mS23 n=2 Tax=Schistosoma japonicum TaxID=6182 RepID=C1LGW7_SCHJA|nr:28S ribosomal protein S23, mitochondrial [Schistosoma japonicum]KAH8851447.1 28S ribosomal protein S23, mitochondrial [Schistosoma japonicum]KAH8851448.1 28S ribosomal protein S23, mitochondrial [Schistosoma japonicum]KAH8851450.1 28S ribosomal protein S23, mitochondrial [Schistosoma japonicum]KAH8851451.1 28S ribosomal protein S23, mitochondrial [Schistosoma japonicum]